MIKKIKFLFFFSIFFLLVNCSFDKTTGIWNDYQKELEKIQKIEEAQSKNVETVKIYSSTKNNLKEVSFSKKATLSEPLKNLAWEMPGLNLQNSQGNIYLSGVENAFLRKKIGKKKFSQSRLKIPPLIINNNIILADDSGTIFSINFEGKLNWKKNIYKKLYKKLYKRLSFVIYKEKIYVVDNIGFLYSINLIDGQLIWIKNHEIPIKSNIKILGGKLFFINQDNVLTCIDLEKGIKIWDVKSISSFIKSQTNLGLAISKNQNLITLDSSGNLTKLNTNNGRLYWQLNVTGSLYAHDTDFFTSSDVVIQDNDIIFGAQSSIFSFNLQNGLLNWEVKISSSLNPIIHENNVFIISNDGYFINLNRKSGKTIWSTNILKVLKKRKRLTNVTGFIMGSDKIYAVTLNGFLIVNSAYSGKVEFFKKIGDTITAPPAITKGALFILTEKSRIVGFN